MANGALRVPGLTGPKPVAGPQLARDNSLSAIRMQDAGGRLAVGVAVFTTEMSPRWLRGPLALTTELLAAIPSVIYGLWAIFVLVPLLRQYLQPWLARYLGWTGLFEGPPYGIGMLAAGII